jgi:hypothetical protein
MENYQNKSGDSGVSAFEVGEDFIRVRFTKSSDMYTYNYSKPGKKRVEKMKQLAWEGKGLSTYISREVKDNFFSKSSS